MQDEVSYYLLLELLVKSLHDIRRTFSVFTFAEVQNIRTVLILMERRGLTLEDVDIYIKMFPPGSKSGTLPCPECDACMALYEVNSKPGNMVGGDDKTQWLCHRCGHAIFSDRTLEYETRRAIDARNLMVREIEERLIKG